MITGMNAALSGLRSYVNNTRVHSNNIANTNTTGFKRSASISESVQGGGVRTAGTQTDHSQGSIHTTGNPMDVAIQGSGYFRVTTSNGSNGYTRSGSFHLDSQNRLTDAGGNTLSPSVTIPGGAKNIVIEQNGAVAAEVNGQRQNVGNIEIYNFSSPNGLEHAGGNIYHETAASGQPFSGSPGSGGMGEIHVGALEGSNVDIAREMVGLIQNEVGFKAQLKTIQTADEMLGSVLSIKA